MFTLALAAAALSAPVIDANVRGIDRKALLAALIAPESVLSVRGKRRYCFDDRVTDPRGARRVCRTLVEWRWLGLEPIIGRPVKASSDKPDRLY